MKRVLVSFILILSSVAYAKHELGLSYNQFSHEIKGINKETNASGKLVSNGNPTFGFYYNWFISPRFHFVSEYQKRSFRFSDISKNLTGTDKVESPIYNLGFKYVLSQSIAISLVQEFVKDISFKVNTDSKVELLNKDNSYLRFGYHQLILLRGSNQLGFNAYYGFQSSTNYIKNKTTMNGEGFWSYRGQRVKFTFYGGLTKILKESETLNFIENSNYFGVKIGFYL